MGGGGVVREWGGVGRMGEGGEKVGGELGEWEGVGRMGEGSERVGGSGEDGGGW